MKSESLWVPTSNPEETEKIEKKIWSAKGDNIGKDSPSFNKAVPLFIKNKSDYLISKLEERNEIALEKEEWFNEYQQNKDEINRLEREIDLTTLANKKLQNKIDELENDDNIAYKDLKINTLKGYISKNIDTMSENSRRIQELEKRNNELDSDKSNKIKRIIESN